MKIANISISSFELPTNTAVCTMIEAPYGHRQRWQQKKYSRQPDRIHVLHVLTDEGVEGMCTVGDTRYTFMCARDLEHSRALTLGEDPLQTECLDSNLRAATHHMFTFPGWHGVFDNCLWDIAGKAAQLPICGLIGRARSNCPAFYNFDSSGVESTLDDAHKAFDMVFTALKDNRRSTAEQNISNALSIRQNFSDIPLFHDAASAPYTYEEALVGIALQDLWFEEPLPDLNSEQLQAQCSDLDVPILAPETLMHEWELSTLWLRQGAADLFRANAHHDTTATLKLVHSTQMQNSTIELDSPGGLFGLIHVHLVYAIGNTPYYEYFPGGTRDDLGREIYPINPFLLILMSAFVFLKV